MTLVICPGIHSPQYNQDFLRAIHGEMSELPNYSVFPVEQAPPFSALHILSFLTSCLNPPVSWLGKSCSTLGVADQRKFGLTFICFSAGVVGGIGAAHLWQSHFGSVRAFIALDGWGVPLFGDFPIYRFSHDEFTHWSSGLLGAGEDSFYAEPGATHLDLWRSPHQVKGWQIQRNAQGHEEQLGTTAATAIAQLIRRHETFGFIK